MAEKRRLLHTPPAFQEAGDAGLFPAHAPGGPPLASAKPDLLISRLRQPIHIAADLHVRLEGPAVQLIPEMLAQRRLANLKLSGYLGLGDTKAAVAESAATTRWREEPKSANAMSGSSTE